MRSTLASLSFILALAVTPYLVVYAGCTTPPPQQQLAGAAAGSATAGHKPPEKPPKVLQLSGTAHAAGGAGTGK
jgi:hypothetical protein